MKKPLIAILAAVTILFGCGEDSGKTTSKKQEDKTAQPVQQEESANYVNGITEANNGLKTGSIEFKGSFDRPMNNAQLYLYETEGTNKFIIDSARVKGQNFSFGNKEYESGVYLLSLGNISNSVQVILNPDEPVVNIGFRTGRLENAIYSNGSKENEGWVNYLAAEKKSNNKIKEYRKSASNSTMRAKFEKLMNDEEKNLLKTQQDMMAQYPGTFFAKILTWKQNPEKNNASKYWDDVDFSDESIIHTTVINDRVQTYMQTHSKGTETGFLNGIDMLVSKCEDNERVKGHCIMVLLEGFYTTGKDDICAYIMDNYIYGENCGSGDYADLLKDRASGVRNLQIGSTPPDFTLKTPEGKTINLNSEVGKYDYTLLMFWSSWCHKCEQEVPVLKTVYDKYHSKGFQVIGYSVDGDEASWLQGIEDKGMPWPNVSELQIWEGPVPDGYRVSETPTLFVLNKDRELVLKPERIFHVEDFLEKNL